MQERVFVEFPGLSGQQFELNKVAFTLFDAVEVRWYGIFITLGIVLAFLYATWRGKQNENVILDDILDVGILTVILGVVGARLYYVLTELDRFPTLLSVFQIWNGGLGIYGGIIGGCLGIVIACKVKKISWRKLFDMAAPGVMIAQAVGRWGNFFNGEAYGYPITAEGTRYFFFLKEFRPASGEGTFFHWIRMGLWPNMYDNSGIVYVHPTFLYECVWNLMGFVLVNLFYKRKKFDGQIALMYFAWYGFGRMLIEGFRSDSLYILKGVASDAGLRISQCIGLICFVLGVALLLIFSLRTSAKKAPVVGNADDEDEDEDFDEDDEEIDEEIDETIEELEELTEDEDGLEDVEAIYGEEDDFEEETETDDQTDEEEEIDGTEN